MKPITIHINQLGLIRDSDISLSQLMLFSGESGLGKSYLAILCHYFYKVLLDNKRISEYFTKYFTSFNEARKDFSSAEGRVLPLSIQHFLKWLADDAVQYLKYMLGNEDLNADISVEIPFGIEGDEIEMRYERQHTKIGNNEESYIILSFPGLNYRLADMNVSLDEENPYAFLFRKWLTMQLLGDFNGLSVTYVLPPSRGPLLTESLMPVTGLYAEYENTMTSLRKSQPSKTESPIEVLELFKDVMEGESVVRDGVYRYLCNNGDMPMSAAAASIRELTPLEMIAKRGNLDKISILLEEPEAHLHPMKQRKAGDIIAALYNNGANMQITTHSDYFLRRINELIMLGKLRKRSEDERYDEICRQLDVLPSLAVDTDNMSAYLLERKNGHAVAVKQNLSEGVPYLSFFTAIDKGLETYRILNKALEN